MPHCAHKISKNFEGGDTRGLPLWKGATPARTNPHHGLRMCASAPVRHHPNLTPTFKCLPRSMLTFSHNRQIWLTCFWAHVKFLNIVLYRIWNVAFKDRQNHLSHKIKSNVCSYMNSKKHDIVRSFDYHDDYCSTWRSGRFYVSKYNTFRGRLDYYTKELKYELVRHRNNSLSVSLTTSQYSSFVRQQVAYM